ncbi:hypothetical protein ACQ9ZF_01315 [Cetobacterium somerae]|uniref:hypothetical protein n=1 Tax=Cetobacterium somerae TaxID=188913 RepID=UPI003D769F6A
MKKLALLLGSLLVVGATASAKEVVAPVEVSKEVVAVVEPVAEVVVVEETPTLKLSRIQTGIWSENRSGKTNGDLGSNSLRLNTKFTYGPDWYGFFNARRYFTSNQNGSYGDKDLFAKAATRTYVGIGRNNIFDNYGLEFAYVSQGQWDKFDVTASFAPTSWLSGYAMYEYKSAAGNGDYKVTNDEGIVDTVTASNSDAHYVEVQPKLSYNGWGISYYFEGEYAIENDAEYYYQQVRLFTPAVTYGDFSVSGEYRGMLQYDSKDILGRTVYGVGNKMKNAFDVNRVYLLGNYAINDSTSIFTNLGYEFGKWEEKNGSKKDSYMTIVEAGVTVKF